jgi:hypothetical protein
MRFTYWSGPTDRLDGSFFLTVQVSDEALPDWSFGATVVQDDDGRLFVKNLSIGPRVDGDGVLSRVRHEVTRSLLRSIDTDAILAAVIDEVLALRRSANATPNGPLEDLARFNQPVLADAPKRGRPRQRTEDLLSAIAERAIALDPSTSIHNELAREFSRTPRQIRDDLRAAVLGQWLAPARKQGARGGYQPGPRLIERLTAASEDHP